MKWFDEIAQSVTYPLRATMFDKVLMLAQAGNVIALIILVVIALVQYLCLAS